MAKRTSIIAAFVALLTVVWPSTALALGVAGFDFYRLNAKNPDSAFHFNLEPGQSTEDRIVVKNTTTDTVQNLRIYAADGVALKTGGISLRGRLEPKKALAKWIQIASPPDITLAPSEQKTIWFRLRVPAFSESQEKFAGLVVERAQAVPGGSGQFIVNVLPRVAILISQRLPGPAIYRLDIVDFSRQKDARNENTKFGLVLENKGNVHVRPKGRIDVYGTFGNRLAAMNLDRMPTIFPETKANVSTVWSESPWIGYFRARATVTYGKGKVTSREIRFFEFPWWVLPVLLGAWIVIRTQRNRRAARRLEKLEAESAAAALAAPADEEPTATVESTEDLPAPKKRTAARTTAAKKPKATAKPRTAKSVTPKTPRKSVKADETKATKTRATPRKPASKKTSGSTRTPATRSRLEPDAAPEEETT